MGQEGDSAVMPMGWDGWGGRRAQDADKVGAGHINVENVTMGDYSVGLSSRTKKLWGTGPSAQCREGPQGETLPQGHPLSRKTRLNE